MIMKTITNPKFLELIILNSVIAILSFLIGYIYAIKTGGI